MIRTKSIIEIIGVIGLIAFSFYYTDRALNMIKNYDPIMTKIKEAKNSKEYDIDFKDAIINQKTMIPGNTGQVINVNKSYAEMKKSGIFDLNLLVFDDVKPNKTIEHSYDKYIISGNQSKPSVALVFTILPETNVDYIINTLAKKSVTANFFIDGKWLSNHILKAYELADYNFELYNYGYDHVYNKDLLIWTNNTINKIAHNKSIYCLNTTKDDDTLSLCQMNKMYTIIPSIITGSNPYSNIKRQITNGSIILFNNNDDISGQLPVIIDFILSKGYKIEGLSRVISEK